MTPEERVELLEVMLQQAVWTIGFLHGCLTEPNHEYAFPEQTLRHLEEFERLLPPRKICIHSKTVPGCVGCEQGNRAREIRGRWLASLGALDA